MTAIDGLTAFVTTPEFLIGALLPVALAVGKWYGGRRERRRAEQKEREELIGELVIAVAAFRAFMLADDNRWAWRTRLIDLASAAARSLALTSEAKAPQALGVGAAYWFTKHDERVLAGQSVVAPIERLQRAAFRLTAASPKLADAVGAVVDAAITAGGKPKRPHLWRVVERRVRELLQVA